MVATQCAECGATFIPTAIHADVCESCEVRIDREHQERLHAEALQVEARARAWVRCPDHRGTGATACPRGGAALQIWQRQQWEGR
jgi:methionyl-tRNA synthetase